MKKAQSIAVVAVFLFMIYGAATAFIVSPKEEASLAERRALADFPAPSAESVVGGAFFDELDAYLADNIFRREWFRSVKANFGYYALGLKENNSISYENGYLSKIETHINGASVKNVYEKASEIYEKYLLGAGTKNYFAIIPDKGYFFAEDFGYPSIDYEKILAAVPTDICEYIDIFPALSLEDYYKTDTHWSQERLFGVLGALGENMGFIPCFEYETTAFYPFYGVYVGQAALDVSPDTIYCLSNRIINACAAFDGVTGAPIPIYDAAAAGGRDGYDVFLGGARGIIKIESPLAESERELIVFRDSFGSSIAPLLSCSYRSVTLIDTRYVGADEIGKYVDFQGRDVLFLYGVQSIENSFSMR